jgi:hypothetical protein
MVDKQAQLSQPQFLNRIPLTPEDLIAMGAEKMADFIEPGSDVTEHEVVEFMLELFDNPTAIEALDREMQRRTRGTHADRWH